MRWLCVLAVGAAISCGDSDSNKKPKAKPSTPSPGTPTPKTTPPKATQPTPPAMDRGQMWRNDIRALRDGLVTKHVNPFFKVSKSAFESAISKLEGNIGTLTDTGIVVEMSRIVAMIGDGHTQLDMSVAPRLPILLYWLDDGMYVVGIAAEHDWAMGKKLHSIGGIEVPKLIERIRPMVPHDNEPGMRLRLPQFMVMAEVLHHLGVASKNRSARFSIADGKGGHKAIELELTKGTITWAKQPWPKTLRRKNLHFNYWNEHLAEHDAVYMKYNRCADMKSPTLAQFAASMLAFIDQKKIGRVIIDLRGNPGGNSMLFRPLLQGLVERKRLKGKIVAIIDRAVFSSALLNSIELAQMAGAKLVGEATSGKPNHYGEVKTFKLPHSGLRVSYSTKFFRKLKTDPPSLEPDVKVPVRIADILAGKDAALEAALRLLR